MDLNISFAKPVGPYDLLWNKCVGQYCHVEISIEMEKDLFGVIIDSNVESSHNPKLLEALLTRVRKSSLKKLTVCFYVMWGDVVSVRFLNELTDDPLMRPPEEPVYETITINLEVEELQKVVGYNLRQLGKTYDIPRALLLFSHFTLRTNPNEVPSQFFCSQLVMHTLKHAGIYEAEMDKLKDINHMTPLMVYEWLKEQKPRIKMNDGEDK
tara:strand:+ start:462 stop:1094 length:633 start_codon:yes stop_codon:yes gene_type:complete